MNKIESGGNQVNQSFSLKDKLRRTVALGLTGLALSGPMTGEVRGEQNPMNPSTATTEKGVMPSQTEAPTLAYAERLKKIKAYKEELTGHECKPENLDFCARVLYAMDESDGFTGGVYGSVDTKKTILKNYLDRNKVINFGKTGKGLEVIYFKDNKGKKTDRPALLYVPASDWNVGLKQVQTAIDNWEKVAPGFLEAMYKNDVCVFFQSKVTNTPGDYAQYNNGIILYNCGLIDKKNRSVDGILKTIRIHLGVEMFGARLDELGEPYLGGTGAVIKQALAVDCNEYLAAKTGDKFFYDRVKGYGMGYNNYLGLSGSNPNKINELIAELKTNNWITPYGAETWAEIDGK